MASSRLYFAVLVALISLATANSEVKIHVSKNFVKKDYALIKVSWSGVVAPTAQDAVTFYMDETPIPAASSTAMVVPVRYKWANTAAGYASGAGSLNFKVLNYRRSGRFYYMRNVTIAQGGAVDVLENSPVTGFLAANVIAKSVPISADKKYPTQIHMAYTNVTGEVLVQWTTGKRLHASLVAYGTSKKQLHQSAKGYHVHLRATDMCGSPATDAGYYFPGFFNRVLLKHLLPSTVYYYQVSHGPVHHFLTPPAPGGPVKIIAWADSGQATDDSTDEWEWSDYDPVVTTAQNTYQGVVAELVDIWQQDQGEQGASLHLTKRMAKELSGVSLLIHEGDISYARGSVSQWDTFFYQYSSSFNNVPYMALPGNHERDFPKTGDRFWPIHAAYDSGGECGVAYSTRLAMPQPSPAEQWYSFDHGPIHFLQLASEQPFGAGSPQYIFAFLDLAAVNRSITPWVVVGFHRPIYTTSIYGHEFQSDINVAVDLRTAFEEMFFMYEVDMTWSGHTHMYERTCPLLKHTCMGYGADNTANAPVHMNMGHGGFEYTWFMNPKPPVYWDAVFLEHGYMRVEANATNIHIIGVSSNSGDVMDDFTLVKPAGWRPVGHKARKHILDYFISNYTVSSISEYPGMSSDALWTTPLYAPVSAILAANTTLLDQILAHKPDFMVNINQGDTVQNLASVFQYYYQEFHSAEFHSKTTVPEVANAYLNGIIYPLLEFFASNSAKAEANSSFDAGTVLAPKNHGAPGATASHH